jgi:hypothetical protein
VTAQPDFYALRADGAAPAIECRMYFTNQKGEHDWQLPERMTGDTARPEIVK